MTDKKPGPVRMWALKSSHTTIFDKDDKAILLHPSLCRRRYEEYIIPVIIAPASDYVAVKKADGCRGKKRLYDPKHQGQFRSLKPCCDCPARPACPHDNQESEADR